MNAKVNAAIGLYRELRAAGHDHLNAMFIAGRTLLVREYAAFSDAVCS